MTEQSAIQYLEQRAKRLGWVDYDWGFQFLVIAPRETLTIEGQDYLYLIVSIDPDLTVESALGYYGLNNRAVSHLIEEHTGTFQVVNRSPLTRYVRFLQGIPRNPQ